MKSTRRPNFLEYKRYRYLKLAGLLAGTAALAYWPASPAGASYGGTWFGYVLGIVSALLILLLAWYGIRKRRPPRMTDKRHAERRMLAREAVGIMAEKRGANPRRMHADDNWRHGGSMQGWLSSHIYLGVALLVLVTLHSGFRFAWNVQTLAYVLVVLIVASGIYGAFAYLRYPRLITENIGGDTLDGLLEKIAKLDELAHVGAQGLPEEVVTLVSQARQGTRLGGSFFQQLGPGQRNCPTQLAVERVQELAKVLVNGDHPRLIRDLYSVLLQKQHLVGIARNEIRLNARMQFWLYLHVPLALGLLAALLAHVVSIIVFW